MDSILPCVFTDIYYTNMTELCFEVNTKLTFTCSESTMEASIQY